MLKQDNNYKQDASFIQEMEWTSDIFQLVIV